MQNHVEFITSRDSSTPSVENISQSLNNIDDFNVKYNYCPLLQPKFDIKGLNFVLSLFHLSKLFFYFLKINIASPDVIIIHKTLSPREWTVAEKMFLSFENVVYSTYDAEQATNPEKTYLLMKESDLVIATSDLIYQQSKKLNSDTVKISPSVDVNFFRPKEDIKNKKSVIGWMGDAKAHKENLKLLKSKLEQCESNFKLKLVGKHTKKGYIKSIFEQTDIDVEYYGWVKKNTLPSIIGSFDVGLSPLVESKFNQGRSSEKVREYLACGVPVFSSRVGEQKRLVADEVGWVVDNSNFSSRLDEVIKNQYFKMKKGNTREYAIDNYSVEEISKRIHKSISHLIEGSNAPNGEKVYE